VTRESTPEFLFAAQAADSDVLPPLEREYRFCTRLWRLDFVERVTMLAFEIEGGVWSSGRHVRGQGFIDDCEKYNEAAILGWHVLRFPAQWVYDGTAIKLAEWAYATLTRKDT
jgi:hypothetical protein